MTLQEKFEAALTARGAKRDHTARSKKYLTLTLDGKRYYLGKSGALRVSSSSIAASHPVSDRIRMMLLEEAAIRKHAAETAEMDI